MVKIIGYERNADNDSNRSKTIYKATSIYSGNYPNPPATGTARTAFNSYNSNRSNNYYLSISFSKMKTKYLLIGIVTVLILAGGIGYKLQQQRTDAETFKAPGKVWQSPKKIEDYFHDSLGMTYQEAAEQADKGVSFYVTKGTALNGIVGNLTYYGIVRDEKSLRYALEHTKDTIPGNSDAIKIGSNTIDINAFYSFSRDMDTWQVADALLNKPHYLKDNPYNYIFMPGRPDAPEGDRPIK